MYTELNTFITLDGNNYPVVTGSYVRAWDRFFTSQPVANLVRINYIDRGPGIKTYTMTLMLATWDPTSLPYKNGVTQTALQQMSNLDTSYAKISTALNFIDPFGNTPDPNFDWGVFFTDATQRVPNYATTEKPYILVDITLIESSGTLVT
jgi:hypothetical protein